MPEKSLRCPGCGAGLDISFVGPRKDRVGVCRFCGSKVDLPESLGSTEERITERPDGTRVVERVTRWESRDGQLPPGVLPSLPAGVPAGPLETFLFEGREYASLEELKAAIRSKYPDFADQLAAQVEQAARKAAPDGASAVVSESVTTFGSSGGAAAPAAGKEPEKKAVARFEGKLSVSAGAGGLLPVLICAVAALYLVIILHHFLR